MEIYPGFAASEVLEEDGRVVGIATGDMGITRDGTHGPNYAPGMELRARYTIFAEGCHGSLTKKLMVRYNLREGRDPQTFGIGINVWRMGDAVLVGSCCEPYSSLQKELRSRFPDHTIVFMNLINGSIGYLPPAELYDVDVYPVWQTPFDRGSLEQTCETMTHMIREALAD